MVVQLPHNALAAAVGVQIYSYLCLICSSLMIFLVCKHRERDSYVALFSCVTLVSTSASIAQQLHTIVSWDEIKTAQFHYVHEHVGSPELAIAGPSYGLDLVLFYIQYYCYNVEGFLTLFWAFALAFSIYCPSESPQCQQIRRRRGRVSKAAAFLLPAIFISFLQLPVVRSSTPAFITLADFSLASSLSLGSILVVVILVKYIQTRRKLHRWTVRYPLTRDANDNGGADGRDLDSEDSIYDGWLIVRFAIALFFIEAFQILTILSEVAQINNNKKEALPAEPDLSAAHAKIDFVEFMPGVSAGLLVFLVFGTTRTCQRTIFSSLVPRRFRPRTRSTRSNASTPRFDHQSGTFLTSPSLGTSPRRSPEPTSPELGEQTPRHMRPSYPEFEHTGSQYLRSRAADSVDDEEVNNIDVCSLSSYDASKLSHRRDTQEGQSSMC
ncbi:hypothetical protein F4859DRAFT_483667 [Xylaria cf. heliscus]|nr:hypothetical protein F4859DRAFT_483667 [Xylaria cf. heliscus]